MNDVTEKSTRAERAFLALCMASGKAGREALECLTDGHFTSPTLAKAAAHVQRSFDQPLDPETLPDAAVGAVLVALVAEASGRDAGTAVELKIGFLALELRRLNRELALLDDTGEADGVRAGALRRARKEAIREAAMLAQVASADDGVEEDIAPSDTIPPLMLEVTLKPREASIVRGCLIDGPYRTLLADLADQADGSKYNQGKVDVDLLALRQRVIEVETQIGMIGWEDLVGEGSYTAMIDMAAVRGELLATIRAEVDNLTQDAHEAERSGTCGALYSVRMTNSTIDELVTLVEKLDAIVNANAATGAIAPELVGAS